MLTGVYLATKKDKTVYYRSNITHKGRHISLGSFPSEVQAHQAYTAACELLSGTETIDEAFYRTNQLAFEKIVSLINFRDNHMYIPTPIYLRKNYFSYYLSIHRELKFDIDDLFYYSSHRILTRQGHLYVNHYGMQLTLLGRYGIKTHAVNGRDFCFVNGDENDFRYSNLKSSIRILVSNASTKTEPNTIKYVSISTATSLSVITQMRLMRQLPITKP